MRVVYSKVLIAIMIFTMIGSTTVGAAGASAINSKQPSSGSNEALTSLSVYAGSGEFEDWDGAALEASFRMPQGVTVLKDGTVLVADSKNHLIRKVKNGQVSTFAGFMLDGDVSGTTSGGWHDGAKQTAVFNNPMGMDSDSAGNIYIADTENHRIRKISTDGTVSTIAGDGVLGSKDGSGTEARFYSPQDIAVAEDGTVYVADTLNHSIRRIAPDGQVTSLNAPSDRVVEVIAGYAVPAGDYADGALSTAKFNEPSSLVIDNKGNLYVSDAGNHLIRYIDLAKGTVSTAAGLPQGKTPTYAEGALYAEGGYADGSSAEARFYSPKGLAITEEQGLVIADSFNHAIRYLINGQVSTIAGVPTQFGYADGINGHHLLHHPTDVAVLSDGSILIADSYNNTIRELQFYKLPNNLPQHDQVKVVLEDQVIDFDAQPVIVKGRTMVPVRALSEAMSYKVDFNDNERTIDITRDGMRIRLQEGSRMISSQSTADEPEVNQEIDAAPFIKAGRTYVPLRFFSEAFGVDVRWDQKTKTVILREIAEKITQQPATDRHSRVAKLEEIKGTVWIKQAGGALAYRAYNGTSLHHGDYISTEVRSSAVLKTVDRKDEITISENSELYISNLSNTFDVKNTSFVLWNGLVGASVSSLINSKDTFRIMTPTVMANVRGTNLAVSVDPVTGIPRMFVNSGLVQINGNGAASSSAASTMIYPGQQASVIPGSDDEPFIMPGMVNPADLVNQFSPAVIEAILKQKQKIDQENAEMLERIKNGIIGSNPNENPFGQSQDDLAQYQENLNNLLANIAKQALSQNKMDANRLQALIAELNKQSAAPIDLNNVPPLQLSEQQKQQIEKQKQMEELRRKQLEEQNKQREQQLQAEEKLSSLLVQIQAEKARKEQENKRQQEEAAKRAAELFKQRLSEEEKLKFEQQQQALAQQKQQQEREQKPNVLSPSQPAPVLPVNHAPEVVSPILDMLVHTEEPIEFNLNEIFHDADGDSLTFEASSSNTEILNVKVEGSSLRISPSGMGSSKIIITASDGRGGTAETSFKFGLHYEIYELAYETTPDSITLHWGLYWEDNEGSNLGYSIYINDELYDSTLESTMEIAELKPNTTYMLRVIAMNENEEIEENEQIVAFADLAVTTDASN